MAIQQNIITDLSTATRVPGKIFEQLIEKENLCIGSAIHEALLQNETAIVLNIGIGSLSISLTDMQCKFIPSKDLKATIKQCKESGIDPLSLELEETFVQKLLSLYQGEF